jgi:hypothetical protein
MTLVLASRGLVIADSLRMIDGEKEFKTGKIYTYQKPVLIQSKSIKVKDYFFGYAGSGDDQVIKAAGEEAARLLLDQWVDTYRLVDQLRCLSSSVGFRIMFFGLKGILTGSVESGNIILKYIPHNEFGTVAAGSGSDAYDVIIREFKGRICPVVAMFAVFALEPTCGGAVEVWRYPLSKKERLQQLTVLPAQTLPEIFRTVAEPLKFHYPEEMQAWQNKHTPISPKPSPRSWGEKIEAILSSPPGFQAIRWKRHLQEISSPVSKPSPKLPRPQT